MKYIEIPASRYAIALRMTTADNNVNNIFTHFSYECIYSADNMTNHMNDYICTVHCHESFYGLLEVFIGDITSEYYKQGLIDETFYTGINVVRSIPNHRAIILQNTHKAVLKLSVPLTVKSSYVDCSRIVVNISFYQVLICSFIHTGLKELSVMKTQSYLFRHMICLATDLIELLLSRGLSM